MIEELNHGIRQEYDKKLLEIRILQTLLFLQSSLSEI